MKIFWKRKIRRPFTELISVLITLLLVMGQTGSILAEASYRTVAILDPPRSLPPQQTATWHEAVSRVRSNPRILLKDEVTVRTILAQWAGEAAEEEKRLLDEVMSLRGKVRRRIDAAWDLYYRFDFPGSRRVLEETIPLLDGIPSTELQAGLLFEIYLLDGMNRRAQRNSEYRRSFRKAAALNPEAVLEAERYPPDIIGDFREAKRKVLEGPRSTVSVTALPAGGSVLIDGRPAGDVTLSGFETFPGVHFVEVVLPGFRSQGKRVELAPWESGAVSFRLSPTGPTDPPGIYFVQRLEAGDGDAFRALAGRLDVDRILMGSWDGIDVRVWLVDVEGTIISEGALWSGESGKGDPGRFSTMLLDPEEEWGWDDPVMEVSLNVPVIPERDPDTERDLREARNRKWYLIIGGALLLAVAAGSMEEDSGGTKVDVSW